MFSQYLVTSQVKYYELLKWQLFNDSTIINSKVFPSYNRQINKSSNLISFYYTNNNLGNIIINELYSELSHDLFKNNIRFNGQTILNFNEKFILQNAYEFEQDGKDDDNFLGTERDAGHGFVGYLYHSSINYIYSSGHFSLGRGNIFYYNFNESLLINSAFPPSEYLWWKHEINWLQFDWGILLLNKIKNYNRFITFHRYGINNRNWSIGFSEAVLGSYKNLGSAEIGYMMPAAVHIETEVNRGVNFNLMWLIDGIYKINGWTFYGELLIDDFSLDGMSPDQMAWNVGFGRKLLGIDMNVEYTYINRWVGNYCNVENDSNIEFLHSWIELDVPIGHSIGSDASLFNVNSLIMLSDKFYLELITKQINTTDLNPLERLKEWPDNVPCEANFGFNEPAGQMKSTDYYNSFKVNYIINKNILFSFGAEHFTNKKSIIEFKLNYKNIFSY